MPGASKGRCNNFDFLRFFLATLVIFSHSYPLIDGNHSREPISLVTSGQTTGGELAVDGFFLLSGYLIAQSWEKSRSVASYLKKRVLRIYPGFIVAVLICAFGLAPLLPTNLSYYSELSPIRLLCSIINLNPDLPQVDSSLPVPAVNGSLWTIRFEFWCYLGVALLGLLGALRLRPLSLLVFALTLTLYAGRIYYDFQPPGGWWSIRKHPVVAAPSIVLSRRSGILRLPRPN